jgi:hypothetical protein
LGHWFPQSYKGQERKTDAQPFGDALGSIGLTKIPALRPAQFRQRLFFSGSGNARLRRELSNRGSRPDPHPPQLLQHRHTCLSLNPSCSPACR